MNMTLVVGNTDERPDLPENFPHCGIVSKVNDAGEYGDDYSAAPLSTTIVVTSTCPNNGSISRKGNSLVGLNISTLYIVSLHALPFLLKQTIKARFTKVQTTREKKS